ncbi:MAG TPA: DUF922 domain-containing protein [Usitatibacter sp.]|nr:DUF922 domain-containing protein [Usitatibacter sp.]
MRCLVAAAFVATAWPAMAQVHMCQGADGRKTFSDVPCGADAKVVDVRPASGGTAIDPAATMANEYYDIRGLTFADLRHEIDAKGPEGWWGTASTRIAFHLETRMTHEGCAVASVRASADSKVRLPRWANRHEALRPVQDQWDSAFRSLDLHERGHVRISLETARDVERAIRAIPPAPSCEAVEAEAKRRADELGARERQRQLRYDAETDHGRRQWSPYR